MEQKVVLITGTSRGIGEHLAAYFVERGHKVIGCGRSVVATTDYQYAQMDITDENDVKNLFWHINKDYGRLDILINNAGIASMNHCLLTPIETVSRIYNTNVIGLYNISRESAKLMKRDNYGRIVNITSIAVPMALEGESVYASSKAAVESITKIMSKELQPFGITVNAVGPSSTMTGLVKNVAKETMGALLKKQTVKKWAEFHDIINVIDFFVSPASDFITGQIIYLGGVS